MALSGKYEADIDLKASADKHYKRWRNENHHFPDAVGHHIQGVSVHEGEWDSHGSIKVWNFTCDGKQEIFKQKTEINDEKMSVTFHGLDGHVMEDHKMYQVTFQFVPKPEGGCIGRIIMEWEKHDETKPEPIKYMEFLKQMVADMDTPLLKDSSVSTKTKALSGTYEADIDLKASADKHYKRWRNENHHCPDSVGHHIQGVSVHEGEWDSHGAIKIWNYTCDGKQEIFKERREIDDEKKAVIFDGLEGHVMEDLKVYHVTFQFIPKPDGGCTGKIIMLWEKRDETKAEPIKYMEFLKQMVADMDTPLLKVA